MKAFNPRFRRRATAGFGLLEIIFALGILAGISGTVFLLAQIMLQHSSAVVEKQRETMHRQAFFDLMKKQFSELPGNAVVDLTFDDPPGNGPYLSQLTLQNFPMIFSWGGNQQAVKSVQIDTVIRRDGFLDVVLKYYDIEILEENNETQDGNEEGFDEQAEPIASVVLLEGVRWFEWQVLDQRTSEWINEWQNPARQPVLLQLDVAFGDSEENFRQIFWIPPKQNPVALMRQLGTRQGGAGGGGQAPGIPGAPGTPGQGGGQPGGGDAPSQGGTPPRVPPTRQR